LIQGTLLTRGKPETISLPETEQTIQIINVIDWLL